MHISTGKHLSELCKFEYPKYVKYCLWLLAEFAVICADIPEGKTIKLTYKDKWYHYHIMLMHALASSFLNYPLIHVSLIIFKLRNSKIFQFFQFVAVIGTAFALNILFHIPIWTGVLITGLSTLLLLSLQRYGVIYFITYLKFSALLIIY